MSQKRKHENTEHLSREELIERVHQLEAHVKQLQNVIAKGPSASVKSEKTFLFKRFKKRHVALKFLYLGWHYDGYVVQEDTTRTIETAIFDALQRTKLVESRDTSNYHRCGRTDKGVSAFSQVITLDLRSNLTEGLGVITPEDYCPDAKSGSRTKEIEYVKVLNGVLPQEIRMLAWAPVQPSFSARFDCKQRTYRYFFPRGNLDIDRMQEGAQLLVGEHDFRNLCKMDVGNGVTNFTRRIFSTSITELSSGTTTGSGSDSGYSMLCLEIVGQAFLWHQVRCIVAVLFHVGLGLEEPRVVSDLLDVEANPRKPQYSMASEFPLVLYDCQFEGLDWQYSTEELVSVTKQLQKLWVQMRVKSDILYSMLKDVGAATCMSGTLVKKQAELLLPGPTPRVYKPLLQRPLCESLEERIAHFAKRRKATGDDDRVMGDGQGDG